MPFEFRPLEISEIILVTPKVFHDARGFFMETYKHAEFASVGIKERFVQMNLARSNKNVLRGLHYQKNPMAQGKLVQCIRGKIFDVAVDIRKGSRTFGKWVGAELSEESHAMLWIPPGFAHGYLSLEDDSEVLYATTQEYAPEEERGILWNDPAIGISWPAESPLVSSKDAQLPSLLHADSNFYVGTKR